MSKKFGAGTFFGRMTAKQKREGGIDKTPLPRVATARLLGLFYGLPLDRKEQCLESLGNVIREAEQGGQKKTAAAFQKVYDDWYKTITQEQADRAFE